LVPAIEKFYKGNEQLQRDEAIRSIGIVSQPLMLSAKSAGYDSCPMIGFDSQKVVELINLPQNYIIGMMLAMGKARGSASSRGGQFSLDEVVFTDRF
jgi:nitroreductase